MKKKKRYLACRVRVKAMENCTFKRLHELARMVQEATNLVWSTWERGMIAERKDEELREFLEDYARWKGDCSDIDEKGPKPSLGFAVSDSRRSKAISVALADRCWQLHSRVRSLVVNATIKKSFSVPSRSCPRLKLWQAVLLQREAKPCSTRSLPIPFDSQNASLEVEDGSVVLYARLDRYEADGHIVAKSNRERIVLEVTEDSKSRYAKLIHEAACGLRSWAGSTIQWNRAKRRWVVTIVVEASEPIEAPKHDTKLAAVLSAPAKEACWRLDGPDGKVIALIGTGRKIGHLRRRLAKAKDVRRNVDWPNTGTIGHGRKRRMREASSMTGAWERTTRTLNEQAAWQILRALERSGNQHLTFVVPPEDSLLNTASGERGPSWPVYHFTEFLQRKCVERGIALRIIDGKSSVSEEETTACGASGA